jgi:hypothetical protein
MRNQLIGCIGSFVIGATVPFAAPVAAMPPAETVAVTPAPENLAARRRQARKQ